MHCEFVVLCALNIALSELFKTLDLCLFTIYFWDRTSWHTYRGPVQLGRDDIVENESVNISNVFAIVLNRWMIYILWSWDHEKESLHYFLSWKAYIQGDANAGHAHYH